MKTEKAVAAYNILSTAKYGKLEDADKIKVWKIARAMKPIATKFDEDMHDASEKLKPTEDFGDRLMKAQQYEAAIRKPDCDAQTLPMGAAEYGQFIDEFKAYQKLVADAMKEFSEAEVEVNFEPLTEEAFGQLMASNEWTVDQALALGDIICSD